MELGSTYHWLLLRIIKIWNMNCSSFCWAREAAPVSGAASSSGGAWLSTMSRMLAVVSSLKMEGWSWAAWLRASPGPGPDTTMENRMTTIIAVWITPSTLRAFCTKARIRYMDSRQTRLVATKTQ